MEINRKQKTLAGLFLKYVVIFCVDTILIITGCGALLIACSYTGLVLPANYIEVQITENTPELQKSDNPEKWIPRGCDYGIYENDGKWKYGSFTEKERTAAWKQLEDKNIYGSKGNYYRFILMETGDVCIIKYSLYMRYAVEAWNHVLPAPEIASFFLDIVLIILNAVLLARYFARKLNVQLGQLRDITEKISENDLSFETGSSDIREINDVMISLSHMKNALKDSLEKQWDMEQQKQIQLAALTHDIKTPLTIIRGNAELLAEDLLSSDNRECTEYILANVGEMEQYLEHMKQILNGTKPETEEEVISCIEAGEILRGTAMQLAAAEKIPVSFDLALPSGKISCSPNSILRAWKNILSNAAEHTDRESGINVKIWEQEREDKKYLIASVRDYGKGYSPEDLLHAELPFYSGDASRHQKSHQGLGLSIAKKFIEEQGGFLQYQNHEEGGAITALWIKLREE